jgi:hypothetical protein
MSYLHTVRNGVAGFLLAASLILLVVTTVPLPQEEHSFVFSAASLAETSAVTSPVEGATPAATAHPLSFGEQRRLHITWPQKIRLGDTGKVTLALEMEPVEGAAETPGLFDAYQVVAEARLDKAAMQLIPASTISEPMAAGRELNLYWQARPAAPGKYKGTLWLYLNLVPKAGGEVERRPLVARPIEMQVTPVLGLPAFVVRWACIAGVGLAVLLGMPLWIKILKRLWPQGDGIRA